MTHDAAENRFLFFQYLAHVPLRGASTAIRLEHRAGKDSIRRFPEDFRMFSGLGERFRVAYTPFRETSSGHVGASLVTRRRRVEIVAFEQERIFFRQSPGLCPRCQKSADRARRRFAVTAPLRALLVYLLELLGGKVNR